MEMDIYERESIIHSISNLAMLKLFHDSGIDVTEFNIRSFMVDVHNYTDESYAIFHEGLQALFDTVHYISYGEDIDHFDDEYKSIFEDEFAENTFIIEDAILEYVLASKYASRVRSLIKGASHSHLYTDAELNILPKNKGIVINAYYMGFFHEMTKAVINIRDIAVELKKKLESEKDGILDSTDRSDS